MQKVAERQMFGMSNLNVFIKKIYIYMRRSQIFQNVEYGLPGKFDALKDALK